MIRESLSQKALQLIISGLRNPKGVTGITTPVTTLLHPHLNDALQ